MFNIPITNVRVPQERRGFILSPCEISRHIFKFGAMRASDAKSPFDTINSHLCSSPGFNVEWSAFWGFTTEIPKEPFMLANYNQNIMLILLFLV
jgi:hypothetical protein